MVSILPYTTLVLVVNLVAVVESGGPFDFKDLFKHKPQPEPEKQSSHQLTSNLRPSASVSISGNVPQLEPLNTPLIKDALTELETCWLRTNFRTKDGKTLSNTCAGYLFRDNIPQDINSFGKPADDMKGILTTAECFFAKGHDGSQITVEDNWLSYRGNLEISCGQRTVNTGRGRLFSMDVDEKNDVVRIHKAFASFDSTSGNLEKHQTKNLAVVHLARDCQTAMVVDYSNQMHYRKLDLGSDRESRLTVDICKAVGYKNRYGNIVLTHKKLDNKVAWSMCSLGNPTATTCFKSNFIAEDTVIGPVLCAKKTEPSWLLYGMGLMTAKAASKSQSIEPKVQFSAPSTLTGNLEFLMAIRQNFNNVVECKPPKFDIFTDIYGDPEYSLFKN